MKNCPFCAEEIQDAAIVCKHCGRNLPTPQTASARKRNPLVFPAIGAIVAVGLVALMFMTADFRQVSSSANERDGDGKCQLHARAALVARDTPLGRAMRWDTDVLAIRSLDKASWYDLEVSIFGFVTTATEGKQPTGRYQMKRPLVLAGEMTAFNLGDFQKPTGEQWISLTMVVDSVDLKALLRGEPCATEVSASTSVSEIINVR